MVVAVVVNSPHGAIGLMQGVVSLHNVTVASLVLRFDITSMVVVDFVLEGVLGIRL